MWSAQVNNRACVCFCRVRVWSSCPLQVTSLFFNGNNWNSLPPSTYSLGIGTSCSHVPSCIVTTKYYRSWSLEWSRPPIIKIMACRLFGANWGILLTGLWEQSLVQFVSVVKYSCPCCAYMHPWLNVYIRVCHLFAVFDAKLLFQAMIIINSQKLLSVQ